MFFAVFEEVDDVLVGAVLVFDLVCFEPEAFFGGMEGHSVLD